MKRQDYFGTFLETVKQSEPESGPTVSQPEGEASPMDLLQVVGQSGSVDLATLQTSTALPFQRFADHLNKLQEAGLVQVVGSPGAELVEITPAGLSLTQLE